MGIMAFTNVEEGQRALNNQHSVDTKESGVPTFWNLILKDFNMNFYSWGIQCWLEVLL